MRKLALLLAFLMIGSFVFAQDEESEEMTMPTMEEANQAIADLEALKAQVGSANLVPSFSGSGSVTFGVDLNSPVRMGFQNGFTADMALTMINTSASKGEGDVVGYISLTGIKIAFDDDDVLTADAPGVEAKIILAPLSIKIYSAPSFSVGNAASVVFDPDGTSARNFQTVALSNGNVQSDGATATTFQGVTVTAALDAITLNVLLASDGDWTNAATPATNYNDFAFGVTFSGSADPLTFNGGVLLGPTDAMDIGFTVGVDVAADPLTIDVGFDGFLASGAGFGFDASLGIGVGLGVAKIDVLTYLDGTGTGIDLDAGIVADLSALAEPLTLTTSFDLVDILEVGGLRWESDTSVSYNIDGIKPFATFGIDSQPVTALTAGVEFSGMIENVVFTLQYANTDFATDSGKITFATKISY